MSPLCPVPSIFEGFAHCCEIKLSQTTVPTALIILLFNSQLRTRIYYHDTLYLVWCDLETQSTHFFKAVFKPALMLLWVRGHGANFRLHYGGGHLKIKFPIVQKQIVVR